jgi:Glycosyl-4,4'-diaponeurosporenoate acyltransferase
MADQPQHKAAWIRWLTGASLTVSFALAVVWGARAYGRSIVFAFGVNWVLMMWAIMFASNVVPLRLPAPYYVIRSFEKAGRVYDLLGVRWYRRALRRVLWSVNPTLLRSQPAERETMIERTKDAETGHLFILLVITGITVWALASGWWDTVGWLLLFNLLHNGYPVLSMRQLRARLNAGSDRLRNTRLQPSAADAIMSRRG